MNNLKRFLMASMATLTLVSASMLPAQAYYHHHYYYDRYQSFGYAHPYVQKALIGGGIGALAGGLLSPEGNRAGGALKGAAIGGGAGIAYQALTQHRYGW